MDITELALKHAPTMRKYGSYKKWANVHLRAADVDDLFKKAFECVCQDGEVIAAPAPDPDPELSNDLAAGPAPAKPEPAPKKKRKARKKKAATHKQAAK